MHYKTIINYQYLKLQFMAKFSRRALLLNLLTGCYDYFMTPCSDGSFDLYEVTMDDFCWVHTFSDFRSACEFVTGNPQFKIRFVSKLF